LLIEKVVAGKSLEFSPSSLLTGRGEEASPAQPSEPRKPLHLVLKSALTSACFRKILWGLALSSAVTLSWTGATQCLKSAFTDAIPRWIRVELLNGTNATSDEEKVETFHAPFFTAWLCSSGALLFLPLYLLCQICRRRRKSSHTSGEPEANTMAGKARLRGVGVGGPGGSLADNVQGIRDKGFTLGERVSV